MTTPNPNDKPCDHFITIFGSDGVICGNCGFDQNDHPAPPAQPEGELVAKWLQRLQLIGTFSDNVLELCCRGICDDINNACIEIQTLRAELSTLKAKFNLVIIECDKHRTNSGPLGLVTGRIERILKD